MPSLKFFTPQLSLLHDQTPFDKVVTSYHPALQVYLDSATTYRHLGYIFSEQGKLSEAISAYQQAILLNDPYAYANLGVLLEQQGKFEEALSVYRQATDCTPNNIEPWVTLAKALERQGKLEAALTAYCTAIQLAPQQEMLMYESGLPNLQLSMGRILQQQGKLDEAITAYCKAIELGLKAEESIDFNREVAASAYIPHSAP